MDKIKSFSEYCEEREDQDEEKGLGDIDAMPNEDEILIKLAKIVISRHQERFVDFLSTLSKNDDDIKRILGNFRDKRRDYLPQDLRTGSDREDKDVVATSTADMSGPV